MLGALGAENFQCSWKLCCDEFRNLESCVPRLIDATLGRH
jgi:hypothetical protein